jgi:hypothetical protein
MFTLIIEDKTVYDKQSNFNLCLLLKVLLVVYLIINILDTCLLSTVSSSMYDTNSKFINVYNYNMSNIYI